MDVGVLLLEIAHRVARSAAGNRGKRLTGEVGAMKLKRDARFAVLESVKPRERNHSLCRLDLTQRDSQHNEALRLVATKVDRWRASVAVYR